MGHDLRYAARQLRRYPAFALSAILVLALGIGVGTAMFSVLHAELQFPLPCAQPSQLVTLAEPRGPEQAFWGASHPDVLDWRRDSHSLEQIAFYQFGEATLEGHSESANVNAFQASANLFATLGVPPQLGRVFNHEDVAGHTKSVVLSAAVWQRWFHGRPDAIGQSLKLDGEDYTVIGVMPASFQFPIEDPADVWQPYLPPSSDPRVGSDLNVIARLRPQATRAEAQAELSGIQARIAREYGTLKPADRVVVRSYKDTLIAGTRPALEALALAVGVVWLIACASVAGLLLTRTVARRRELAVRAAMGASRGRLVRQLLSESLLLGLGAAALGWGIAEACLAGLRPFLQAHLLHDPSVRLSLPVLAALLAATALSILLVGLAPALGAAAAPAAQGLQDRSATGNAAQRRMRDGLVAGEIALALLLLAGAGLLLRTLYALGQVPLGFATANIVTTRLQIPHERFARVSIASALEQPVLAHLEALPDVAAAAFTSVVPLASGVEVKGMFRIVGRPGLTLDQEPQGDLRFSSPDYPKVFGIPLERGRFFDARLDTPTSARVVVVNHTLAAKYFPGVNPVGQQISIGKNEVATIIGVLADVRGTAVAAPPEPEVHFSTTQLVPGSFLYNIGAQFVELAVRVRTSPARLAPEIRAALHVVAPDVAAGAFATENQLVATSLGDQRFAAQLLGIFALAALAIALAGLYGLLAYGVAQRTREIGIRLALGAEPRQILGLVLGRAAWLLAIGIGAGLALALAFARVLAAYLYGVPARDPGTLAAVSLLLAAAGLAAAYLPARRAARISPLEALRAE
ncbi:MAG: ADOP family duplicated permease [Terriglobales bacterium]